MHHKEELLMSDLLLTLGKDASGVPIRIDLTRMPNLLIGGMTGSGKTFCIESLLSQLQHLPEAQLIIRRLDATAAAEILDALRQAEDEMTARLARFYDAGARQIGQVTPALPRLLYIIDEFSPLMLHFSHDLEQCLMHLAQGGRRAGIHLILSTQRTQPEVITGLIRANFPSRIAFRVLTAEHSRCLLDHPGAEKLLRPGDMLFYPAGAEEPVFVHCTAE